MNSEGGSQNLRAVKIAMDAHGRTRSFFFNIGSIVCVYLCGSVARKEFING